MSDERVQPGRLLDLIRSKNFEGRKALIDELRAERTKQSTDLLLEILSDESWSLRELAVSALADREDLAAPHLLALLDTGLWYSKAAAARTLGVMGHGRALSKIVRLIDDPNRTVAEDAGRALLDLARRGWAAGVARGLLARDEGAEDALKILERIDPDDGRKIRILVARDEIRAPVMDWLESEERDPTRFSELLAASADADLGIGWERISGPVGG